MIPDLIPIRYEPGSHAEYVGRFDSGQYVGFCFYLEPEQNRPVALLHRFDGRGDHTGTEIWEGPDAEARLAAAVAALPGGRPGGVRAAPFAVEAFGATVGLIPREDGAGVEYRPYGLAFFPPWDGTYDT